MIKKPSQNQLYLIMLGLFVLLLLAINEVRFDYMIFFGNQYYSLKNFENAESYYSSADKISNSNDYMASNNLGNVQYDKADYDSAVNSYSSAAEECMNDCDTVLYNLGNSLYKQGEKVIKSEDKLNLFKTAVSSYEKSLDLKEDPYTRENMEFVLDKIEELKKAKDNKSTENSEKGKDSQGEKDGEGASENKDGQKGEEDKQGQEKENGKEDGEGGNENKDGQNGEEGKQGKEKENGKGSADGGAKLDEETTQQVEQYMQKLQQIEKDAQQYHKRTAKEQESQNDMFQDFFGRPSPFANDPFFNRDLRKEIDNVDPDVKDW